MAAKKKAQVKAAPKSSPTKVDSLIKTVSEVEKLSDKEKEAFRKAGGTTINNPIK